MIKVVNCVLCPGLTPERFAARLVERGAVPRKAAEDALHIVIAAVHGVDYSRSISEVLIALNGTRYRMQCHA